jgi:ADP-ribosylglycohydrolase
MELDTYFYNHILGGVYGQALGDAWAMPAYFRPDQTWAYFNNDWINTLAPAPPDHPVHAGFQAGQITDDTQQALALAQVIITEGQITVEGAARAIVAWYEQLDGDVPYVGPSTRRAVAALKSGGDPYQTGLRGDTNGGAMRISPIGLIHPGNPEAAVEDAVIACTPTHFTDLAVSGACAVAAAVAQALTPDTTLEDIIDIAIRGADYGRQHGTPWLGASVARKIDYAVQLAGDANLSAYDRLLNLYDLIGSTLSPADAVPCAFGVLAMANGSPVETAIYAAALSGDADTVGAMACAIAGAWHGIESIPADHIETLNRANPAYDFAEFAKGLHHIAQNNYQATDQPQDDLFEAPL